MGAEWMTALQAACPEVEVRLGEPMAEHVSFRLGGPAAAMAFPNREEQVRQLLAFCDAQNITPLILGAGTNVLPPDGGLETLVLCLKGGLMTLERQGDCIVVGAGVTMAQAAAFAADQGLAGLEFAHGIPGTMGGGVYMNAGAYGGELCQVCVETTVLRDGELVTVAGEDQGFAYRRSAFQNDGSVILRTVCRLTPDDPAAIRERMRDLAQRRRNSQPLELPSAGSTFKRPVGGYAAALIEQAGLKGFRVGGASVSTKHAGFVVNDGGATCADVLALIAAVQKKVLEQSGIQLEPEVRIL